MVSRIGRVEIDNFVAELRVGRFCRTTAAVIVGI